MLGLPALRPGERRSERRVRLAAAADAVFGNADIVFCILHGNVGTSTYAVCSALNKTASLLCHSSEALLRGVALYRGGLTKTLFCGLFAVGWQDAAVLPHSKHARWKGGAYCVYGADAVETVLREHGGMCALRDRRRLCALAAGRTKTACGHQEKRALRAWELEEQLHRRAVRLRVR